MFSLYNGYEACNLPSVLLVCCVCSINVSNTNTHTRPGEDLAALSVLRDLFLVESDIATSLTTLLAFLVTHLCQGEPSVKA